MAASAAPRDDALLLMLAPAPGARPAYESHLPTPGTSAAGSDSGRHQLEDLVGQGLSDHVVGGAHLHRRREQQQHPPAGRIEGEDEAVAVVAAAEARVQAAAATSTPQQTSPQKETPATSLAKHDTRSISASSGESKPKTNPTETSQKAVGKNYNAARMSARSSTPSASRRAAPINIQIVRLAPTPPAPTLPSQPPSISMSTKPSGPAAPAPTAAAAPAAPRYDPSPRAFTMSLLPMTKIRELCLHAAGYARRHGLGVLDGSRLEARDRDGHVFEGHETLSEEVLSGETIYLVEGGLDARGPAMAAAAGRGGRGDGRNERPRATGARGRGRLLCLGELELEGEEGAWPQAARTPYRTPSVSSRASASSSRSEAKAKAKAGAARMTPSQRALAVAQMGCTPTTQEQAVVDRKLPTSSAVRKTLPSPALEKAKEGAGKEARGRAAHRGELAEVDDLEADLVAASPLAQRSPSPQPSPPPQPQQQKQQQKVPPYLQDSQLIIPDSQDPFSQDLFSQQSDAPNHASPAIPIPDTSKTQPRSPPRVRATIVQPKLPTCKPDPYDIDNVLSDGEDEPPHLIRDGASAPQYKMVPPVRRLGSATAARCSSSVAPPPVSFPSPHRRRLSEGPASRTGMPAAAPATRSGTSTPTKKITPVKAEPSSPTVPLPSSPTTHVAAAMAKEARRSPRKDRRPSLPSPSQVVYRIRSDSDSESDDDLIEAAFRDLSSSIPTPSLPWSAPPLRAKPEAGTGVGDRSPRKMLLTGKKAGDEKTRTSVADDVFILGVSPITNSLEESLGTSPGRKPSLKSPVKASIITSPSTKENATIIHDSSSTGSDGEEDMPIVKREPAGSEENSPLKARLPDVPTMADNPHVEKKQIEVMEISSDSNSDMEPFLDTLDDDEAELPSINVQPAVNQEQLPSLSTSIPANNQSPARNHLMRSPVKVEPALKEPPCAQASKRKRPASEEPEAEDEQRRNKRAKRQARKKLNREREAAKQLQERERQLAALQDERKKLALEKARRRALELEMIVSSPVRRESSIDLCEEGSDDNASGAGVVDDACAPDHAGVPLDGDDKNDSLSSREAEGGGHYHPSWRRVSKLHLSSTSPPSGGPEHQVMPTPASAPAMLEAELEQCVEERFHRMPFDDWAFLESTLGRGPGGGYEYSPLEVHNRVHLDMVRQSQRTHAHDSDSRESTIIPAIAKAKAKAKSKSKSKSPVLPREAACDDSRSQRSEAPSPKEHRAEEEKTRKMGEELREQLREEMRADKAKGRIRVKTRGRLEKDNARKREGRRKANGGFYNQFRKSQADKNRTTQKQGPMPKRQR